MRTRKGRAAIRGGGALLAAGLAAACGAGAARADLKIVSTVTVTGEKPAAATTEAASSTATTLTVRSAPAAYHTTQQDADTNGNTPADGGTASAASAPPKPPAREIEYTTLIKGQRARREAKDGHFVLIYDRKANKVYTLDTVQKTFYERSFKDTFKTSESLPTPLDNRYEIKTDLSLDKVKESAAPDTAKREIADLPTSLYHLTGEVGMAPKRPGGGGNRGGFGGGGGFGFPGGRGFGFPGGGGGRRRGGGGGMGRGGGQRPATGPSVTYDVNGEYWVASAEKILPAGKDGEQEMALALIQETLPSDTYPLLGNLSDDLAKNRLLPLESVLTLHKLTPVATLGSDTDTGNSAASTTDTTTAPKVPPPLEVRMSVRSIDSGVALPDSLFAVPPDYAKVPPPDPPAPFPVTGAGGSR